MSAATDAVRAWHDNEGCCTHDGSPASDTACCVCDTESPCDNALIEAKEAASCR